MSKSLEALEILRECANGENKVLFSTSLELADTIKQDLELLEQLKQQRDSLAINNGELCVKVTDFEKDDQEIYDLFKARLDKVVEE